MNSLTTFLCGCLLLASVNIASAQLIVAHRGASHDAPENTLAAFELAWEQGADAIEGDFYLTADHQIICIHDRDTARICLSGPTLVVTKSKLSELRKIDAGRWKGESFIGQKLPTLAEVLAIVPEGKKIFLEIKSGPEILPELKKQLDASALKPDQIVLICFQDEVIRQARKLLPDYEANLLVNYRQEGKPGQKKWVPSREQILKRLAATRASGLGSSGRESVVNQEFIAAVKDAGYEFHVWTINDPDQAEKFADWGAQSITTDRPELIRSRLRREK